jgi:ABC-type sulfate/molybdate transport systems ATPase subunit
MIRGLPKDERQEMVVEALRLIRMEEYGKHYPRQLSGGQQQRVGLARALVYRPKVLLLDEPLSNLDAKLREQMRFDIKDLQRRLGITAVYVTHDQAEALALSDRVAVMNRGRIEQVGTPDEIYDRPGSQFWPISSACRISSRAPSSLWMPKQRWWPLTIYDLSCLPFDRLRTKPHRRCSLVRSCCSSSAPMT